MMHITQQKEQFSKAFIQAIAAVAGYAVYEPSPDDDSIDLGIAARGGANTTRRPRLELQVKCTQNDVGDDENLAFDLEIKNYNDLRVVDTIVPRILVVVVVPQETSAWVNLSNQEMCLRHYAVWKSLIGLPETSNTSTVRIHLPRSEKFTPEKLQELMFRINERETL